MSSWNATEKPMPNAGWLCMGAMAYHHDDAMSALSAHQNAPQMEKMMRRGSVVHTTQNTDTHGAASRNTCPKNAVSVIRSPVVVVVVHADVFLSIKRREAGQNTHNVRACFFV